VVVARDGVDAMGWWDVRGLGCDAIIGGRAGPETYLSSQPQPPTSYYYESWNE